MQKIILLVALSVMALAQFQIEPVSVKHNGQVVEIQRQSVANCKEFATAPQFVYGHQGVLAHCMKQIVTFAGKIQPMYIDGVQTVGELEVLEFLKNKTDDALLVDARGGDWLEYGTIPGSTHIFHGSLDNDPLLEEFYYEALAKVGVRKDAHGYDMSEAKDLVVFCNGAWCPQSTWFIQKLTAIGYPKQKLRWYRGGIFAWQGMGLTIAD